MKNSVQEKLNVIKDTLDKNFSYIDIVLLEVRKSNEFITFKENGLSEYLWLMKEYEYMRLGDIIFWLEEEMFKKRQIYLMVYEVPNPEEWMCIGEVEPYPLLINKKNGTVTCVISEPGLECEMKEYGELEQFMDEFVLGKRYFELGTDEEWYEFMEKHKII